MAMFDGTFMTCMEEIMEQYPIKITDNVWTTKKKDSFAIINDFEENTPLYNLADPHMELNSNNYFYHVFVGDDAKKVINFLIEFICYFDEHSKKISLIRKDKDMYMYGYGLLDIELLFKQDVLREKITFMEELDEVLIVPLKVYKYQCPVCGHRTLLYRGYWLICYECGWEDAPYDDEDEVVPANGRSVRMTREHYIQWKRDNFNKKFLKHIYKNYSHKH